MAANRSRGSRDHSADLEQDDLPQPRPWRSALRSALFSVTSVLPCDKRFLIRKRLCRLITSHNSEINRLYAKAIVESIEMDNIPSLTDDYCGLMGSRTQAHVNKAIDSAASKPSSATIGLRTLRFCGFEIDTMAICSNSSFVICT
jgi:hypothetical protein